MTEGASATDKNGRGRIRIEHVHMTAADPARTASWYVTFLGAAMVSENLQPDGRTNYHLDLHGLPLTVTNLIPDQKAQQTYGIEHLAIEVGDFDQEVARLKAGGADVLEETLRPSGRRVSLIEGPEGVRIEVMEMR